MRKWKVLYQWTWLNELLRGEGRGDYGAFARCICGHPACQRGKAEVRCKDCDGCEGYATACMVRDHLRNPLHRRWNWGEGCYDRTTLKDLGLSVHLCRELHPDLICPHPRRAPGKSFVVMDSNGIHDVDLFYCDCGKGPSYPTQLLRMRWLPSTGKLPRTAATF
ncbi:hypothetical protein B0H15DRAFT_794161, partial [Mycena belliarum]